MKKKRPFIQDPSATAAFAALRDLPLPRAARAPRGDKLHAVVIGGGTGAPVSIRTLLSLDVETSAVVAMADDGGSTGLLREEADVTPPGDVRKCILAMAADPKDPLHPRVQVPFPHCEQPFAWELDAGRARGCVRVVPRGHFRVRAHARRAGTCVPLDADSRNACC